MTNQLANAQSAYLRSAAHQPIHWYEFGEEAFRKAKEEDKPLLLDIGAVWCHWCHVIDRESYENPEIAALINEHYIPVKVDRDERPDIDARYQQAVSAISGQGGWPLTGFLTYDGRVLYGGTYFPPQTMKKLLLQIREVYQNRKADIFREEDVLSDEMARRAQADIQAQATREILPEQPGSAEVPLAEVYLEEFADNILDSARAQFDAAYGGFGAQPKFPHFSTLMLLIAVTAHQEQKKRQHRQPAATKDIPPWRGGGGDITTPTTLLDKTLMEMARGGVYDQIAGGFHRYSVDRYWHVPHFEKMAYDNAEALKVYAQAYRLTGNRFYRDIAYDIVRWVDTDLSDPLSGGFYASQDADINLDDDGDHFTWTLDELRRILTPEERELVTAYYDVTEQGDMHDRPGRNVLRIAVSLELLASRLQLTPDKAQSLLDSAESKMLAERKKRPIPFIDKTLYLNWNGMFLAAYFEASDLLDDEALRLTAQTTLERMIHEFYKPGHGVYHTTGVEGFLDDYAQFADALLKGYYATGEPRYLAVAEDVADQMIRRFEDPLGGFFDISQTDEAIGLLKFRRKPVEDNPSASPNGVALQVLLQLSFLSGEEQYREKVKKALDFFVRRYEDYGIFVSALGLAVFYFLNPPLKGEVLRSEWRDEHRAESRICIGSQCLPPVKTMEEFRI